MRTYMYVRCIVHTYIVYEISTFIQWHEKKKRRNTRALRELKSTIEVELKNREEGENKKKLNQLNESAHISINAMRSRECDQEKCKSFSVFFFGKRSLIWRTHHDSIHDMSDCLWQMNHFPFNDELHLMRISCVRMR